MRRLLLWNIRCLRGWRCADVQLSGEIRGEDTKAIAGTIVTITYRCGGCGTEYRRDAVIGNHGSYSQLERVRVG